MECEVIKMSVRYPNLRAQIAVKGLKLKKIAETLKMSEKTFSNKVSGKSQFTWPEACMLQKVFFLTRKKMFFSKQAKTPTPHPPPTHDQNHSNSGVEKCRLRAAAGEKVKKL